MPPERPAVATLLAAGDTDNRLALLRAADALDGAGLDWLLDEADELVLSDPAGAEQLAALARSAGSSDPAADLAAMSARAAYLLARIRATQGRPLEALELIAAARRDWLLAGEPLSALRTDLGRMGVLDDLGRHGDAIAVGTELIAALDQLGGASAAAGAGAQPDRTTAERIRAHAMDNLGAAYGFTGRHAQALEAYAQAEEAYTRLGMRIEAARPRANRAVELIALGRPRAALQELTAAHAVFDSSGDQLFAAQCAGDMALAHRQLGQFTEALALLEPARRSLAALGADAEADRLRLTLAEVYLSLGLLPEARSAAEESATRAAAAGMQHDLAQAHFLTGSADLAAGRPAAARAEFDLAEAGFATVGDLQYLARTRLARAEGLAAAGQLDEARRLTAATVTDLAGGGWQPALAWAQLRLIDWADDPGAVEPLLLRTSALIAELRLPALSRAGRLREARWLRRTAQDVRAKALLRGALEDLDRTSNSLTDFSMRAAFRRDQDGVHDELIELLLDRGDAAGAAAVSERAKARTLRDLRDEAVPSGGPGGLGGGGAFDGLGGPGDDELTGAQEDLNATYVALHETDDPASRTVLADQALRLERRVGALRLRPPASSPDLSSSDRRIETAAARRPEPAPTSPSATGPALAYHVLGDDVVAFCHGAAETTAHRLPGVVPKLNRQLDELTAMWSRTARLSRSPSALGTRRLEQLAAATRDSLRQIYDLLIRPVEGSWDSVLGRLGDEPVLHVVPHGMLGSVPFHALHDGRQHLIERCAVTVAPTLALTLGPTAREDPAPGPALVVSVPDEAIPAAEHEAVRVADALTDAGRDVRRITDASTDDLCAALPAAAVVHLACHGTFRAENPLFSRLRLADRWLTAAEIVRLRLPGSLVTLSACESGRSGEAGEPIGLGWAFLSAGASGVVVSQWMVDDAATGDLMAAFYAGWRSGRHPAQALRAAQRQLAAERPHPYFWAPFSYLTAANPTPGEPR